MLAIIILLIVQFLYDDNPVLCSFFSIEALFFSFFLVVMAYEYVYIYHVDENVFCPQITIIVSTQKIRILFDITPYWINLLTSRRFIISHMYY